MYRYDQRLLCTIECIDNRAPRGEYIVKHEKNNDMNYITIEAAQFKVSAFLGRK